jgi:Zn-dependent protease with chaperone function
VFQVDASKQSSKVNAYVTGLFGSKRIVLYDTLIKNFSIDEIEFVMAHEMGHYVMHHIWWGIGVSIFALLFTLWAINRLVPLIARRWQRRLGFSGLADYASLPLVLLCATVLSFVFQPVTNAASRLMERQADTYGMRMSGVASESAVRAFDKLSVYNLSDPSPSPLVEFWFYSHPALSKRMAFARSWTAESTPENQE